MRKAKRIKRGNRCVRVSALFAIWCLGNDAYFWGVILCKRIFAGECKYHAKPVDAPVYFTLKEKVDGAAEIRKAYPGYDVIFGVFSKSSFTQRMLDIAKENTGLLLINEDHLV